MKIFDRYFEKNPLKFFPDFPDRLALIIVIPVFDDPDIFRTLNSLLNCRVDDEVGIILVVNHAEHCEEELKKRNSRLYEELKDFFKNSPVRGIYGNVFPAFDLPSKQAGVGMARKIGMDAAAWYFWQIGNEKGGIASLDADTLVDVDYCRELIACFAKTNYAGITIAYEHVFPDAAEERTGIMKYELYLRYYRLALLYIGHPYAYSCLGSAFAVRAEDYVAQGGMNKKQAGEDFYFIQKLIATGRFVHLNRVKVYPAGRISERTPFGTGQVVLQIVKQGGIYDTYHVGAFEVLKPFFRDIPLLYKADAAQIKKYKERQEIGLQHFLEANDFVGMVVELNANCAAPKLFLKRFFDKFNAFRVLKYLNYVHPFYFQKQAVEIAAGGLLEKMTDEPISRDLPDLLTAYRKRDI